MSKNLRTILAANPILVKPNSRFQASTAVKIDQQTNEAQNEWEKARPFHEMPTLSAFSMLRAFLPGGKYYQKDSDGLFKSIKEEYGDIFYFPSVLGKPAMVVTNNPADFEQIYRHEGIWPNRIVIETLTYYRKKHRADFFKGAEGLVTTQGEEWGKFRSAVNPVLLQPKIVRLYLPKMAQVNQEFLERIKKIRDPKTNEMPKDFQQTLNRWSLESISVVALDKQLGLLKEDELDPLIQKLFKGVNGFIRLSGDLDTKPSLWKYLPVRKFKQLMQELDNILEVTSHYVNEAINRLAAEEKAGITRPENEKGVLEKLLKIDRSVAIIMAMDMLTAGIDTTSNTFASILLAIAQNPDKQAKLREEVRRILPNKDSEFTEKSLLEMPYLRACMKEAMRVYPLIIANGRMVQKDVVLSGYRVPKGTQCGLINASLNRDEKFYTNPNEFLPERWLRQSKTTTATNVECPNALKDNNPFLFLPFGFGPRSCIGKRIAEMEIELGLARIIRNFYIDYKKPVTKPFNIMLIGTLNIPLNFEFTDVED